MDNQQNSIEQLRRLSKQAAQEAAASRALFAERLHNAEFIQLSPEQQAQLTELISYSGELSQARQEIINQLTGAQDDSGVAV